MGWGFYLCSAPPTQRLSVNPIMFRDVVLCFLKNQPLMLSQIFYLKSPTQMRLVEISLVIQYEIFSRTLHISFLTTVPINVIPDCMWHCSCVFKHPVHAVVACRLESFKNSIELEEQPTRTTFIWKRPIIKWIFVKHVLINAQTLLVEESDHHHLQYWLQTQPFFKWWYRSNTVDCLNALCLHACCGIQCISVQLLPSLQQI